MNIAIFTWEYPPKIAGGVGTYTFELARQLVKMEHNISVFTLNDGTLKTEELMNGVEVYRPKLIDISPIFPEVVTDEIHRAGPGMNFFSNIFIYNILVSSKINNDLIPNENKCFDVLSVHDWLSSMAGLMLKKSTGLPMVFHIHSTEKGRSLGDGSRIISELERKAADAADRIVTVSWAMRDELISYGFPSDKISVVWNGVDPIKYSPERVPAEACQQIRQKYGIQPDEKMVLFLGRLTGVKGVDRLLNAIPHVISKFPKTKFVILGKGEMEGELVRLADALRIRKNVIFNFAMVPEEERIAHYAACDLAVFPSLYEPFGIVALEAMALKKPVVVGARGISGLREIVVSSGPTQCGYHVNPYDPQDIAWALNLILGDERHAKTLGENARARVLAEFTWNKVADRIIEIYAKAANITLPPAVKPVQLDK